MMSFVEAADQHETRETWQLRRVAEANAIAGHPGDRQ